jgi:hypothetical protein
MPDATWQTISRKRFECGCQNAISFALVPIEGEAMANRVQAALYALREGISSLDEEIEHNPENIRSTIVGPTLLSADKNWTGHPSPVDA